MSNLDLTHRILCRLLSDPADVALTSTLGPEEWGLLAATARREGVAPLLYHALGEAGWPADVPRDVQADLRQAYYANTARNLLIYRELSRILAALAAGPPMVRLSSPQAADRNTQLTSHITHPTSHIPPHAIPNPKSETCTEPSRSIRNPKSGIPVVALKGAALAATLYPSIGLRPMGDVDLLVPNEHLAEVVARLKALGYVEPCPEMAPGINTLASYHVHLQGGQDSHLSVELHRTFHWTLVGGKRDGRSPCISWFWTQIEPFILPPPQSFSSPVLQHPCPPACPEPSRRAPLLTLTPTAHLLYLCAHLILQHGEAHSVLRWFYDIHLLVTRESHRIDWDELVIHAQEFGWAPALHAALAGTVQRFQPPLPAGLLESLIEGVDSRDQASVQRKTRPQPRWESTSDQLASLSWRAQLRLLLAITIPNPTYVRWRYKPRPAWLWPLYYPYRWFDILRDGLTTLWRMAKSRWRVAND